jgi:intracellular sulfur oxidation DsrE/DsrF family protein
MQKKQNVAFIYILSGLLLLLCILSTGVVASEDKPFAEARVVLQLSDSDPEARTRVLNVANNLIKHYGGPDFIEIEIVAFGPGIGLLFPDNPNTDRISSLVANGVKFVGCLNTVESITRKTGKKPELTEATIPVQTGVAHIIERSAQGYVVIRP